MAKEFRIYPDAEHGVTLYERCVYPEFGFETDWEFANIYATIEDAVGYGIVAQGFENGENVEVVRATDESRREAADLSREIEEQKAILSGVKHPAECPSGHPDRRVFWPAYGKLTGSKARLLKLASRGLA